MLGEPQGNVWQEWWISANPRHSPIHVCLGQKIGRHDDAHVMVFDPAHADGHPVIEMRPASMSEADAAIERIMRIVEAARRSADNHPLWPPTPAPTPGNRNQRHP